MAGKIIADTLEHSTAGSIATNYVVNGSAKYWTRFDPQTNTEYDSFNQSSRTDDGVGLCTVSFTNSFNNAYHAGTMDNSSGSTPNTGSGANVHSVYGQTTSVTQLAYGYSGSAGGTCWYLNDYYNQKAVIHGDLA